MLKTKDEFILHLRKSSAVIGMIDIDMLLVCLRAVCEQAAFCYLYSIPGTENAAPGDDLMKYIKGKPEYQEAQNWFKKLDSVLNRIKKPSNENMEELTDRSLQCLDEAMSQDINNDSVIFFISALGTVELTYFTKALITIKQAAAKAENYDEKLRKIIMDIAKANAPQDAEIDENLNIDLPQLDEELKNSQKFTRFFFEQGQQLGIVANDINL